MAEQSLYRRHRPQSFDEVVGQQHVVRTLRNAVERDRIHHAYLFVGSRGTGKTSMAKILARSLNCVQGPTVSPCGECESCRAIAAGSSMDVIEMDAASNRSVDDIRELRERVGYAPAADRWKVYILDEAHMLTREAWNAFLKTLEEPPPSTVFVLATTEPHKVMPTIVDRCQRFDFGRPPPDEIAAVVRKVAEAEGLVVDDGAVAAIARAAAGSFRDALGTLDQLVAYSGTEISTDDALAVLGVADADLLFAVAEAIASGDGRAALGTVAELTRSGHDPSRFATDLVAHLRRLLVIRTAGEVPEHLLAGAEEGERLVEQAGRLGDAALLRSIDELSGAIAAIREGDEARMTLELALLRAARPEIDPSSAALAQRLERVERHLGGGEPSNPRGPRAEGAVTTADQVRTRIEGTAEEVRARIEEATEEVRGRIEDAGEEVATRVAGAAEALDVERVAELWPAVVDQVRQSGSELLGTAFGAARPLAVDPEARTLEVGFPPSAAFNKRKAEAKENRDRFAEALATIVGERLRPVFVLLEGGEEEDADGEGEETISAEELVERLKSELGAEELSEDPPADQPPAGDSTTRAIKEGEG